MDSANEAPALRYPRFLFVLLFQVVSISESNRIESNRIESNRIESNRIESNRIESNRIESNRIESNRIESNRIESNRIESNRIESNRIESNRIDFVFPVRRATVFITALDGYSKQARNFHDENGFTAKGKGLFRFSVLF